MPPRISRPAQAGEGARARGTVRDAFFYAAQGADMAPFSSLFFPYFIARFSLRGARRGTHHHISPCVHLSSFYRPAIAGSFWKFAKPLYVRL